MITYITGGERSGKSSFAQKLVQKKTSNPVFLATARILDKEMEDRVKKHRADRDGTWQLVEEPLYLSNHKLEGRAVLLDCVTLWLTNVFFLHHANMDDSLDWIKEEWPKLTAQVSDLVVVSNEIGMGLHGLSEESRKFTQLHGFVNQNIAQMADEAWLLVSGIPVKLK